MSDKPIIFSAPMVRALLEERKTQTRRVLKEQNSIADAVIIGGRYQWKSWKTGCILGDVALPYAHGDRLYVREAWRAMDGQDGFSGSQIAAQCLEAGYKRAWSPIQYEVDGVRDNWIADPYGFGTEPGRYRHARFMPRWASRLTLTVKDVRVHRLQEISDSDCRAEGLPMKEVAGVTCWSESQDGPWTPSEAVAFSHLWNSLHGPDAWGANPWVCAISFTVHRGNIDQMVAA